MFKAAAALALLAAPADLLFFSATPKEIVVGEWVGPGQLARAESYGARVTLDPGTNMLAPDTVAKLARLAEPPRVVLRPPLERAHREALQKLGRFAVTLDVGTARFGPAEVAWLEALGPVEIEVRLAGKLDAVRAGAFTHLKGAALRFAPDHAPLAPDEVERLRWLADHQRAIELDGRWSPSDAADAAERVPGLAFRVKGEGNRVPAAVVERLDRLHAPLTLELECDVDDGDLRRLGGLRAFSAVLDCEGARPLDHLLGLLGRLSP